MANKFKPQKTQDGSFTFYSDEFDEAFHSSHGAKQEAETKYIQPCLIKEIAKQQSTIRILDICYGLGYNSAAAMDAIWAVNPQCYIELIGLEISADVPRAAVKHQLLNQWRSPIPQLLTQLADTFEVQGQFLQAKLILGDARQTIGSIALDWQADAIFLDPFSPPKCPQLWTVEFIELVARRLTPTGRLATYSCAAAVRTALSLAGLYFGSIVLGDRNSPGTIASFEYKNILNLSPSEQEHLKTRAAVPYRDTNLQNCAAEILIRRQQEQNNSKFEPTTKWKKRWLLSNM
ncbi:MAG: tRNA (5-methylaminomethyl-2-thiouridine)(34)-methyltransferase MnmD [Pleurocapsa sp.]